MADKIANAATKWANAMRSGTAKQNYIDGINATTVNPMAMAASDQAMQLYLQKVQDSVTSGRRRAKLLSVDVGFWKSQSTGIGAQNLSNAATKGMAKVQAHFQKHGAVYAQAKAAAAAIPKDGTISTAMAKVQASIMALKQGFGKST